MTPEPSPSLREALKRCPACHCMSFAKVDEPTLDGGWDNTKIIRCVNCKRTYAALNARPPVGEGWKPIDTAPCGEQIIVGSYTWSGWTIAKFDDGEHKARQLQRWIDGPTVWMRGPQLPAEAAPEPEPAKLLISASAIVEGLPLSASPAPVEGEV